MDLKLKDEITKLLIETPGISISELAKKTGNYYSYTHKLLSQMQDQGSVKISKAKQGKRTITVVSLVDDYKQEWVSDVKRFFKSLMKDAEIKTAFLLMYGFILATFFKPQEAPRMLAATESLSVDVVPTQSIVPFEVLLLVLVPTLIVIWFIRKKGSVKS